MSDDGEQAMRDMHEGAEQASKQLNAYVALKHADLGCYDEVLVEKSPKKRQREVVQPMLFDLFFECMRMHADSLEPPCVVPEELPYLELEEKLERRSKYRL